VNSLRRHFIGSHRRFQCDAQGLACVLVFGRSRREYNADGRRPYFVGVKDFVVLPKRWIVERTFGWLGRWRRHSKDYERNPETSETMMYISMIYNMSRRLAQAKN
jgi:transposase